LCKEIGVPPDSVTKPFVGQTKWRTVIADDAFNAIEAEDECPDGRTVEHCAAAELEALLEIWNERFA
jgi:hypothetical protein